MAEEEERLEGRSVFGRERLEKKAGGKRQSVFLNLFWTGGREGAKVLK